MQGLDRYVCGECRDEGGGSRLRDFIHHLTVSAWDNAFDAVVASGSGSTLRYTARLPKIDRSSPDNLIPHVRNNVRTWVSNVPSVEGGWKSMMRDFNDAVKRYDRDPLVRYRLLEVRILKGGQCVYRNQMTRLMKIKKRKLAEMLANAKDSMGPQVINTPDNEFVTVQEIARRIAWPKTSGSSAPLIAILFWKHRLLLALAQLGDATRQARLRETLKRQAAYDVVHDEVNRFKGPAPHPNRARTRGVLGLTAKQFEKASAKRAAFDTAEAAKPAKPAPRRPVTA